MTEFDDEEEPSDVEKHTAEWVDNADYSDLRSAAGYYEDVNGNSTTEELRDALHEVVDE